MLSFALSCFRENEVTRALVLLHLPKWLALILALGAGFASGAVQAQGAFPIKSVTLVLPFPPGGSTDIVARTIQPRLSALLGQPVLVDNRSGAAGVIATNYVAKSTPDGYTLFLSFDTHAINPIVYKDIPYDTFKDLLPVTLLVRFPLVMGAYGGLPANNLKEFVALAKSQPGKLNYASTGLGSLNHLLAENLKSLAGIDVLHVPYKGGGPAIQAMLTGEVAFCFLSYGAQKGQMAAGKLKPLAVTGARRMADLPDVPTVAESGFPGFEAYSWIGIFAPAGTPDTVIRRLHQDFTAALQDPEVKAKLVAAGFEPIGSTPQDLGQFVHREYDKWSRFVKDAKIRFE
jgi:tripartite-type tricarboxylate transporter receptor subunit TctC